VVEGDGNDSIAIDDPFLRCLERELGFSPSRREEIVQSLRQVGLWNDDASAVGGDDSNTSSRSARSRKQQQRRQHPSDQLLSVCRDYRPDRMAKMLAEDFGLSPPVAHRVRAAVVPALAATAQVTKTAVDEKEEKSLAEPPTAGGMSSDAAATGELRRPLFKSVVVNDAQARRCRGDGGATASSKLEYGVSKSDLSKLYPRLADELDDFMNFMTQPNPYSQEDPIRPATANVYLTHARLFLGWYLKKTAGNSPQADYSGRTVSGMSSPPSIYEIIPDKTKDSAKPMMDFVVWLRSNRSISASYEANLLRGLVKLLKFRFCRESAEDTESSRGTYKDIPVIGEVRKLHRAANRKQSKAPRTSNEDKKWLSWPEFLQVVQALRQEAEQLMSECGAEIGGVGSDVDTTAVMGTKELVKQTLPFGNDKPVEAINGSSKEEDPAISLLERRAAIALQKYLVLAIFANVPDRQRTVRELELGRTFVLEAGDGGQCWCIRHAPDDYKTGRAYGERPPMQLPATLTPTINAFVNEWRPRLSPLTNKLFVQPRTGNPLTQDSVYQIVSRSCYERTGKRTNPHLLRDMIVTHIRESQQASEQELEALALFMGHSLSMQRTSYDRRTLSQKVAPAIRLMEQVNTGN